VRKVAAGSWVCAWAADLIKIEMAAPITGLGVEYGYFQG
jgi:hypothetical protein